MTSPSRTDHNLRQLEQIATKLRLRVLQMVAPSGQGYVQQGLGAADIFTALYFAEAQLDPSNPDWPERDRVFLTTAHNTAIFYATLAERGFFDPELLATYVTDGSALEINSCERTTDRNGQPLPERSAGRLDEGRQPAEEPDL